MFEIPVKFPSERERLRRLIDADRRLSFRERIQAVDGLMATIERFSASVEITTARDQWHDRREAEGREAFRDFIQRQLAELARRRAADDI